VDVASVIHLALDAGLHAVQELLEKWRRRWPSDALDPPEVWERVVALRRCALRAFHTLVPALATSAAVKKLLAFDEGETLLRSAKGLMRAVGPGRIDSK